MFKQTCPYCFNKFSKRRMRYCCPNDGMSFEWHHFRRKSVKCPHCGVDASPCCPICGFVIPINAVDVPHSSIAVVGPSCSGKTVYLTVAINELRNKANFVAVSPLTRNTSLWFDNNRKVLYMNRQLLESTLPDSEPLIWSIKNIRRRKNGAKILSKHTLSILDTSSLYGLHKLDDPMLGVWKNFSSILFVVDSLTLRGVRKKAEIDADYVTASLSGAAYANSEKVVELICSMAYTIRGTQGIENYKKLKIPVAFVFTKMDLVNSFLEQENDCDCGNQLERDETHEKCKLDKEKERKIKWLRDIGEEGLVSAVETNFEIYDFFFVSSLGSAPRWTNSTYTCDSIKPYGVLDPLWWLFKNNHIVY